MIEYTIRGNLPDREPDDFSRYVGMADVGRGKTKIAVIEVQEACERRELDRLLGLHPRVKVKCKGEKPIILIGK